MHAEPTRAGASRHQLQRGALSEGHERARRRGGDVARGARGPDGRERPPPPGRGARRVQAVQRDRRREQDALSDAIASTAATRHPGRIEFTRGYGVRDVDFARRVAVFAPSDAPSDGDLSDDDEDAVSAPYDLLVAADGVNARCDPCWRGAATCA